MKSTKTVTDADLESLRADELQGVAHLTILRRVIGLPVRGGLASRIDRALDARGIARARSAG